MEKPQKFESREKDARSMTSCACAGNNVISTCTKSAGYILLLIS